MSQATTSKKNTFVSQNPIILRFHRLMDAFSKADDERDFYLDRYEGFILQEDLDKNENELAALETELTQNAERYCLIPKLSFYEQKKLMEGFVNEKVYDIDTKEKLLDIIQSKDPRENFLEYLLDLLAEYEKWQQFYQERFRIRIIEWLRQHNFIFVFEEDLEMAKNLVEKVKKQQFNSKATKDVAAARKILEAKAKTYYSNEALNPRPKRGRPPKQSVKVEIEPQISADIYTTIPQGVYSFLYVPDITNISTITFSSKFSTHDEMMASFRNNHRSQSSIARLEELSKKLSGLKLNGEDEIIAFRDFDDDEERDDLVSKEVIEETLRAMESKPKARKKSKA